MRFLILLYLLFLAQSKEEPDDQCFGSSNCPPGLLCINNTCSVCQNSSECQEALGSQYICRYSVRPIFNDTPVCLHKRLVPLDGRDWIIFIAIFFFGALSAASGLGGGGLFVPVLMIVGGLTATDAIPLSNVIIFGASLANFFQMLPKRHPFQDVPLIQYHLALLMQPTALLGTTVGVVLNKIFPDWAVLGLLITTMAITAYRTTVKGISLYKKEKEEAEANFEPIEEEEGLDAVDGVHSHPHEDLKDRDTSLRRLLRHGDDTLYGTFEDEKAEELDSVSASKPIPAEPKRDNFILWLIDDSAVVPWGKLALHVFFLSIVVGHTAILQQGIRQQWLPLCSPSYWGSWVALWPIVFFFTFVIIFSFSWLSRKKKEYEIEDPNRSVYTPRSAIFIVFFSLGAGILSSLLGIGGGILISPLMLDLGVPPDATAATSSFMILWTSLAATTQFAVDSRIPYDYSLTCGAVGLLASVLGQYGVSVVVKKYNKRSMIVFCILAVIILSSILLTVSGIQQLTRQLQAGAYIGFRSYCN